MSLKPLIWIGSSYRDLTKFPRPVQRSIGHALLFAQLGGKHVTARPLTGFGGAGVLEIIEDHAGNTYRAVYTVRMTGQVYVLHAFQKKSKHGMATPKHEIDLIKTRLRIAEDLHRMDAGNE